MALLHDLVFWGSPENSLGSLALISTAGVWLSMEFLMSNSGEGPSSCSRFAMDMRDKREIGPSMSSSLSLVVLLSGYCGGSITEDSKESIDLMGALGV